MSTPSANAADAPARPAGKRATARIDRRERLLDAAERHFADFGYDGTPLRDITAAAGVRLASVTEEFGGKEQLFREVLLRRALPLEADRVALLTVIPGEVRGTDRLARIVAAFVDPMLARSSESAGWGHYFRFLAQLANSRAAAQLLVAEEYNRVAARFVEAFRAACPGASDEARYEAYLFLLGAALDVFADNMRLDSLSCGRYTSSDLPRRCAALRTFTTAGVEALLA